MPSGHLANRCAQHAQLGLFIPSHYDAELQAYKILSDRRAELEKEFERKRTRHRAALKFDKAQRRRRSA